jgi:hypothetical protein
MKTAPFFGLALALCLPAIWLVAEPVFAQEVVEKPTWSVGDWWEGEDARSGAYRLTVVGREKDEYVLVRTARGVAAGPGMSGARIYTGIDGWAWARIDSNGKRTEFPRYEYVRFPLKVGKFWRFSNEAKSVDGPIKSYSYQCYVAGWEEITIASRSVRVLRIETEQWHQDFTNTIPAKTWRQSAWYAPEAKRIVRFASQYTGGPAWEVTAWSVDAGVVARGQPSQPSPPTPPPSAVVPPSVPPTGSDKPPVAAGSGGEGDDKQGRFWDGDDKTRPVTEETAAASGGIKAEQVRTLEEISSKFGVIVPDVRLILIFRESNVWSLRWHRYPWAVPKGLPLADYHTASPEDIFNGRAVKEDYWGLVVDKDGDLVLVDEATGTPVTRRGALVKVTGRFVLVDKVTGQPVPQNLKAVYADLDLMDVIAEGRDGVRTRRPLTENELRKLNDFLVGEGNPPIVQHAAQSTYVELDQKTFQRPPGAKDPPPGTLEWRWKLDPLKDEKYFIFDGQILMADGPGNLESYYVEPRGVRWPWKKIRESR